MTNEDTVEHRHPVNYIDENGDLHVLPPSLAVRVHKETEERRVRLYCLSFAPSKLNPFVL
jgi:hypothetical protein